MAERAAAGIGSTLSALRVWKTSAQTGAYRGKGSRRLSRFPRRKGEVEAGDLENGFGKCAPHRFDVNPAEGTAGSRACDFGDGFLRQSCANRRPSRAALAKLDGQVVQRLH